MHHYIDFVASKYFPFVVITIIYLWHAFVSFQDPIENVRVFLQNWRQFLAKWWQHIHRKFVLWHIGKNANKWHVVFLFSTPKEVTFLTLADSASDSMQWRQGKKEKPVFLKCNCCILREQKRGIGCVMSTWNSCDKKNASLLKAFARN